jgi:hypothetical protein
VDSNYGHLLDGHDDAFLAGMDAAWSEPGAEVVPLAR